MKKIILTILIILCSLLIANSQPNTEWVQRYNSASNFSDYVNDMFVDGQGNIYITGYSNGDILTLKYNTSGELKWVKTYDGPFHGSDEAIAIALDKQNNVYVLGNSKNLYGKLVYAIIKYSNNGEQMWVREYINSDSIGAYPYALVVDDSGNVYITGSCSTISFGSDFGTVKYNTNGIFQWVRFFGGTENISDGPSSITTDNNGNIYVTGIVYDTANVRPLTTIKYDSLGNLKWVAKYIGENNGIGRGVKVSIDRIGNVFVAGEGRAGTYAKYEFVLLKYDTDGNENWARRYRCSSASNGNAYLKDMAIDDSNNVYICGVNDSNQNGWDFTTLKYNNTGDWLWIKRYKKTFNSSDEARSIAVDKFCNIYITGRTNNNTPWYQYCTVKYSSIGEFKWSMFYNNNSPFNFNHEAVKLKVDSTGNVYVTGNSEGNGTGMDIATIKYSNPSGINNITNETPVEYKLFQNYPNPFNSMTNVKWQMSKVGNAKIVVFDILGKEIATLVNEKLKQGTYNVKFDGSKLSTGIYFYRLITDGTIIDIKKLILLK